jgi:hypothetical protein
MRYGFVPSDWEAAFFHCTGCINSTYVGGESGESGEREEREERNIFVLNLNRFHLSL